MNPASTQLPQAALNTSPFHHLYVHIPFCRHKCGYCDFNAYAGLDGLIEPYIDALVRELAWAAGRHHFGALDTIYFGGGTPGLIPAATFRRLMQAIRAQFVVRDQAEVTLEANPASTDPRKLRAWRQAGVNRLSIGVQGFDPRALAVLERRTDAAQARVVVQQAREAGFDNLSLDLIYAVPHQTVDSWQRTLEQAIQLAPEHLSCYCLTLEEGTPLQRRVRRGLLPEVDSDTQWEFLERCRSVLTTAGYRRYEVSSWAKPGLESRHNQSYWECRPVYGAGCGAHSYSRSGSASRRWWNIARPQAYIASETFIDDGEQLDTRRTEAERLMLGLRAITGLEPPTGFEAALDQLVVAGLLERAGAFIRPTERGLDLHNQVSLAVL